MRIRNKKKEEENKKNEKASERVCERE